MVICTLSYLKFRNRRALLITETKLNVMAAAAITGLNSNPTAGYRYLKGRFHCSK